MKKELNIYDHGYFENVTVDDLKGESNVILYDTFTSNCNNVVKYKITRDDLALLIRAKKLKIENVPSVYEEVPIRDKIICLALLKSAEYDVTVYTQNGELALDLLLNGIKVVNENYNYTFQNIGKSEEKNEVYIYDTCTLINNAQKIDFSKNIHYFSTCVLEELLKKASKDYHFFKCLYVLNKYPKNVKILNTVSSTQRGGRYSYTDLLILYSTLRSKRELKNKSITLLTSDRKLFFEAMYLNQFNVVSKFDYFDSNAAEESKLIQEIAEEIQEPIEFFEEVTIKNVIQPEEKLEVTQETEVEEVEKIVEIPEIEKLEEVVQDEVVKETVSVKLEEKKEIVLDSNSSVKSFIKDKTKNYTEISLRKIKGRGYVLDEPNMVEHVYSPNFKIVPPVPRKKLDTTFSRYSYIVHPGYWVTFMDDPKKMYKVSRITGGKAILLKL